MFILFSLKNQRIFSTTHLRTSSRYKRHLGPLMDFTLQPGRPHVFLAQGIGITPFRSIALYVKAHHPEFSVSLIHVSSGSHLFREDTEASIGHASYPSSSSEFYELLLTVQTDAVFYLSGGPSFISGVRQKLSQKGVYRSDIKTDSFLGY